jgi:hypothetical protein
MRQENSVLNKNGIARYVPPARTKTIRCINPRTGKPKRCFDSQFLAERFIAEVIRPEDREKFETYACDDHFHLTTKLAVKKA